MKALKLIGRWLGPESPLGPAVSGVVVSFLLFLAAVPAIRFGLWWLSVWGL
ncbi:hypothetical protein FBZ85_106156 [Azospirillum brasilense]|uniref:Uncharacterized protein n=1 Tax=Azospirillum baldaniorum TaxID=1064539 RepID=A0A9P1JZP6_9PROT|nr:hypothetical protein [Azospirillum baldaniorum]TWA77996.1 hypothetical protein FBZ85_106156 [Azospirillum brasilense]CCD02903.1 protein of unknown function [Azospirillum baldaniorum]